MESTEILNKSLRDVFSTIEIKQKVMSESDIEAIEIDFNNPEIVEENDMPTVSHAECIQAHMMTIREQNMGHKEVWEHE